MIEGEGGISPEDLGVSAEWVEVPSFVSGHLDEQDDPYKEQRGKFLSENREPEGKTVLQMRITGEKPEFRWVGPEEAS